MINSAGDGHHTSHALSDHYTVLGAIEQLWHLGCLANTCSEHVPGSFRELFTS